MDTLHTHSAVKSETKKRLFQELFAVQITLEKVQPYDILDQAEVCNIIEVIDRFMEALIANYDSTRVD
jgi:hypothetical protein